MIEKVMTWDLLPGVDLKAYAAWARKTAETTLRQPGVVEFRANRNLLGNPQIRVAVTWKSLADWARFAESEVWRSLEVECRSFATNIRLELWGPSPIVSEPIRPAK
jgi:hypothetical protein